MRLQSERSRGIPHNAVVANQRLADPTPCLLRDREAFGRQSKVLLRDLQVVLPARGHGGWTLWICAPCEALLDVGGAGRVHRDADTALEELGDGADRPFARHQSQNLRKIICGPKHTRRSLTLATSKSARWLFSRAMASGTYSFFPGSGTRYTRSSAINSFCRVARSCRVSTLLHGARAYLGCGVLVAVQLGSLVVAKPVHQQIERRLV